MYSNIELDALKEISNIGAGNAATALSTMLSKKIKISVPEVQIVPFDKVAGFVGGPENLVVGIFLRVSGEIKGHILIIIQDEDAYSLTESLLGTKHKEENNDLSAMEKSALKELGNIVGSSYIMALTNFTNLSMKPSIPSLAFDMAGAILDLPLSLYGYVGDTAFLIDTKFTEGTENIKLRFFLIPDDKSLKTLLNSIGVSTIESKNSGRDGRL